MTPPSKTDAMLRYAAFGVIAFVFVSEAWALRGLYADGANFLLRLLQYRGFAWWDWPRLTNHIVTELPVVLALNMKAGPRNLETLRYLFSTWVLFCAMAGWVAALWVLRRDALFWPFAILFASVYFGCGFFAIGEYNLCYGLWAVCFALLARPLPPHFAARAGLLIASLLLPLEYPASLFLGALLLAQILSRPRPEWNGAPRWYRYLLALAMLASMLAASWELAAPRDPVNFAHAVSGAAFLRDLFFGGCVIYGLAAMGLRFENRQPARRLLILICVLSLALIVRDQAELNIAQRYQVRAYAGLVMAGFGILFWSLRDKFSQFGSATTACCGIALLTALAVIDFQASCQYRNYQQTFRATVDAHSGLLPYEQAGLPAEATMRYTQPWDLPVLSLLWRRDAKAAIILPPRWYHGYQSFDPSAGVPDLSAYYAATPQ